MFWRSAYLFKPIFVPIIEKIFRWRDRLGFLRLKLAGETTIKNIINADLITRDKVIIFACYPADVLAAMHIRMLSRFYDAGYNVIVVSAIGQPEVKLKPCMGKPWTLVIRRPFGRDFGAYKDVTLLLHEITEKSGLRFKKVVYLNDSVATIERSEQAMLKHLDKPDVEYSGVTENYHKGLHVGSFAMSVGERAFYHPQIVHYWTKFRSYSTRRYAIGAGELGFARAMKRAGFVPDVQWTLARMKSELKKLPLVTLIEVANQMEAHFVNQISSPIDLLDKGLVRILGGNPEAKALNFVNYRDQFLGLSEGEQVDVGRNGAIQDLIDAMLAYVFRGSHIHHGAVPLLYLGAALLKKDVVIRRIIEPFNIDSLIVNALGENAPDRYDISREILVKGHPYSLTGWARLMNKWDFT